METMGYSPAQQPALERSVVELLMNFPSYPDAGILDVQEDGRALFIVAGTCPK